MPILPTKAQQAQPAQAPLPRQRIEVWRTEAAQPPQPLLPSGLAGSQLSQRAGVPAQTAQPATSSLLQPAQPPQSTATTGDPGPVGVQGTTSSPLPPENSPSAIQAASNPMEMFQTTEASRIALQGMLPPGKQQGVQAGQSAVAAGDPAVTGAAQAMPGLPGSPAANPIQTHGGISASGVIDGNAGQGVAKDNLMPGNR